MHLTSNPAVWYAARAAGIVSYVLLSFVVVLGLTMSSRVRASGRWPRFAVEDVHRFASILVGMFLALHVLAVAVDSYVPFSITQLAVPFASSYRPLWTGLGIVAAELLIALAITNALRRRIPYRVWRTAHYLSFVVWLAATVHGIESGTDRRQLWLLPLYGLASAAVTIGTVVRVRRGRPSGAWTAGAVGGLAAIAIVLALVAVPQGGSSNGVRRATVTASMSTVFSGRIIRQQGAVAELLSVVANGTRADFRIDVLAESNSVEQTSLQLRLPSAGSICRGTLTRLDSSGFAGSCTLPGGTSRDVNGTWTVSGGDQVDGRVTLT